MVQAWRGFERRLRDRGRLGSSDQPPLSLYCNLECLPARLARAPSGARPEPCGRDNRGPLDEPEALERLPLASGLRIEGPRHPPLLQAGEPCAIPEQPGSLPRDVRHPAVPALE